MNYDLVFMELVYFYYCFLYSFYKVFEITDLYEIKEKGFLNKKLEIGFLVAYGVLSFVLAPLCGIVDAINEKS